MMQEEQGGATFLDGLISLQARRRTREQTQPIIDMCCSPMCMRNTVLTVGSALLILTTLLIGISLTTNDNGVPLISNFTQVTPLWVLDSVDSAKLATHIQALSSDLMEGRAPGSRGEALAVQYISSHFAQSGILPFPLLPTPSSSNSSSNSSSSEQTANSSSSSNNNDDNSSNSEDNNTTTPPIKLNHTDTTPPVNPYLHSVPLICRSVLSSPPPFIRFSQNNGGSSSDGDLVLNYGDNFTATSDLLDEQQTIEKAKMIFVGYGIQAPEYNWDDYKNVNVSGCFVVCFVNEPSSPSDAFLGDQTLSYYGRWTYKVEKARELGALGLILIHTTSTAGYGWSVVKSSFGEGEQLSLPLNSNNSLHFQGWIDEAAAEYLVYPSPLSSWFSAAESRDFQPIELNTTISTQITYSVRNNVTGTNVMGYLGPAPGTASSIILIAHHDHLGIRGASPDEMKIYNGAVDNASGVASLLVIANVLAAIFAKSNYVTSADLQPLPFVKTIIFMTVTAEESNLLGSSYFASNPPCTQPVCNAVAAINFDGMNVWGMTEDIVGVGQGLSKLMDTLFYMSAQEESMQVESDPRGGFGHLYRSDQLSLIRKGVPSLSIKTGSTFINQSNPGYSVAVGSEYVSKYYHQPEDDYYSWFDMEGMKQQIRVAIRLAYRIAILEEYSPSLDGDFKVPLTV
eukprot:TRINITY_DN5857_c0_g1_i1.p1 TRINITY_DN5857_c0_g1~~TRINITY_DN5857_c0_g1_i1.p1  ORF type:complete len:681 (-),score=219.88 TRINITY_DN5857_c0_g1_i1:65-2107(-)